MTILIAFYNLILAASLIGASMVWIQVYDYCEWFSVLMCICSLIFALATSCVSTKRAIRKHQKGYLLSMLVPITAFICIIVFRFQIQDFVIGIMTPIGPGSMPDKMIN